MQARILSYHVSTETEINKQSNKPSPLEFQEVTFGNWKLHVNIMISNQHKTETNK